MPIDMPLAGPAGLSPGAPPSKRSGAPPGFLNALDDATTTWTASAEGPDSQKQYRGGPLTVPPQDWTATGPFAETKTKATPSGDDAAAAAPSIDDTTPATTSAPSGDDPSAADASELAKAIDVATAQVAPVAVAPVAVPVAVAPSVATPAPLTDASGAAIDPALAAIATQVTTAAAAVATGAPVDPAAPGVAELLGSIDAGETAVEDLPADVQALVAKATAAQAATGTTTAGQAGVSAPASAATEAVQTTDGSAATPTPNGTAATQAAPATTGTASTGPVAAQAAPAAAPDPTAPVTAGTPAATTTEAATQPSGADVAAVAVQTGSATDADATTPTPTTLSPLAAAIQAAATAATGGGMQDGQGQPQGQQPGDTTQVQPIGLASPAAQAADLAADVPTDAAPIQSATPINLSQASGPIVSTAAAPATPTVSGATPGAQTAAIEALVHLSRSSGRSQARIALAPEQLGGIQVTLIFGADGVTARMIADRPEAAAALQRAGQDLRDALQQQGIDLAGLETGFAGDGQRGASREAATSEAQRLAASRNQSRPSDGEQTLHVALGDQPAPAPLAPGRTIDLRA